MMRFSSIFLESSYINIDIHTNMASSCELYVITCVNNKTVYAECFDSQERRDEVYEDICDHYYGKEVEPKHIFTFHGPTFLTNYEPISNNKRYFVGWGMSEDSGELGLAKLNSFNDITEAYDYAKKYYNENADPDDYCSIWIFIIDLDELKKQSEKRKNNNIDSKWYPIPIINSFS